MSKHIRFEQSDKRELRPVFVGGCPRSGTTLLGALLGAHSQCVCVPEMPFKFKLLQAIDWQERVAPEDVNRLLSGRFKFRQWGLERGDLLIGAHLCGFMGERADPPQVSGLSYREAVEAVVRAYLYRAGMEAPALWIDHTPYNIRSGGRLLSHFPEARFIHVIRDGRAVAASQLQTDFGAFSILEAARLWSEWLGYGLALETYAPDSVLRVQYEDMVRHPQGTLQRICGFVGLELESGLGERTEFPLSGFDQPNHALTVRPPDPSRINLWRQRLGPRQIEVFEAETLDLLQYLGYERSSAGYPSRAGQAERTVIKLGGEIVRVKRRLQHRLRRLRHRGQGNGRS